MSYNPFAAAKQTVAEQNKPKTTLIQVTGYQVGQGQNDSFIKGNDLLDKDDNGNPKEVSLYLNDPSGKLMGVKEFASRKKTVHTQEGGIIRADRVRDRGNGKLEARHLQRICEDNTRMREDEAGNKNKIAFGDAWIKVMPRKNRSTGEFATFDSKSGPQHRGLAFVMPATYAENKLNGANSDFDKELRELAGKAFDNAPASTQAMIRPRIEGINDTQELVIPNMKKDNNGSMVAMEKEEAIDAMLNNTYNAAFLNKVRGYDVDLEMAQGYVCNVFGGTEDSKGEPVTSRVESFAGDTQRKFPVPNADGSVKEIQDGNQEYVRALVSIEIPDNGYSATLQSVGRHPQTKPSPVGHPDHVTANPHNAQWQAIAQQNQAGAQQQQGAANQSNQDNAAVSATATAYSAQAPTNNGAEPPMTQDEPPMPTDDEIPDAEELDDLAALGDLDDMDDVPDLGGPTP